MRNKNCQYLFYLKYINDYNKYNFIFKSYYKSYFKKKNLMNF